MARKSKLLAALDEHRGRDIDAEKRKKQVKLAEKKKRGKAQRAAEDEEDVDLETDLNTRANVKATQDSTMVEPSKKSKKSKKSAQPAIIEDETFENFSEDEDDSRDTERGEDEENEDDLGGAPLGALSTNGEASASEVEEDSDVAVSELDEEDKQDTVPHQRMTINNGPALKTCERRARIVHKRMPFTAHNRLFSELPPVSQVVPDVHDDLNREEEFYRIAQAAVSRAEPLFKKENVPFDRPNDYFAEMVKSDDHMSRIKKQLYSEAASKKASSEARAQRDAKKFGKQVHRQKEEERAREKKQTLEKISSLKRKRKGQDTGTVKEGEELFDSIDVEDAPSKNRDGRERGPARDGKPNFKRQKRDSKFGFGGKKRFSKSTDAISTADLKDYSVKRMKGGSSKGATRRPGKARRAAGRS